MPGTNCLACFEVAEDDFAIKTIMQSASTAQCHAMICFLGVEGSLNMCTLTQLSFACPFHREAITQGKGSRRAVLYYGGQAP